MYGFLPGYFTNFGARQQHSLYPSIFAILTIEACPLTILADERKKNICFHLDAQVDTSGFCCYTDWYLVHKWLEIIIL